MGYNATLMRIKYNIEIMKMVTTPHARTPIFSRILVTLTRQNFAHLLRIVTPVCTKSFERIQRVLHVFGLRNDELEKTLKPDCEVRRVVHFFTIENNSRVALIF